jgi:16S rRNA (cytosine967-C5)-methyltransferase
MDPSSQEVVSREDLSGHRLLGDFCAAAGGKSFLLATHMDPAAHLVSLDIAPERLRAMLHRSRLYGIEGIHLIQADLTNAPPLRGGFDFILLDVPCSGLGTIRSNPDIRWSVDEGQLVQYRARQTLLLENGFDLVSKDGTLVYSTCSTEPEENEQVVGALLKNEPRAQLVGDYHRTFPRLTGPGDAFFVARIRRVGGACDSF